MSSLFSILGMSACAQIMSQLAISLGGSNAGPLQAESQVRWSLRDETQCLYILTSLALARVAMASALANDHRVMIVSAAVVMSGLFREEETVEGIPIDSVVVSCVA